MTSFSIDEIVNKISAKFNRIFYDREFVGSVYDDLRTIIENNNKCRVLVFPSLSPNYLRVVRYQARLFDLAVISLGSGSARSIGVCHKKYRSDNSEEKVESSFAKQMAEGPSSSRKKRPPIQLYIPPAQRRSRPNETNSTKDANSIKRNNKTENDRYRTCVDNGDVFKKENIDNKQIKYNKQDSDRQENVLKDRLGNPEVEELELEDLCLCSDDLGYLLVVSENSHFAFCFNQPDCNKFFLLKKLFPLKKLLVFSSKRKKSCLYFRLKQNYGHILCEDQKYLENRKAVHVAHHLFKNISKERRVGIFASELINLTINRDVDLFENKYYTCGERVVFERPNLAQSCCYTVPQYEIFDDTLKHDFFLHTSQNIEDCIQSLIKYINLPIHSNQEDSDLAGYVRNKQIGTDSTEIPWEQLQVNCYTNLDMPRVKQEEKCKVTAKNTPKESETIKKAVDHVIVLEERSPTVNTQLNSSPRIKYRGKQNEHEQEKEIMRKTKKNINRKTRPIIKYVDDDNDILSIDKGDDVNNWEDLFNENGELHDDIFSEVIQKVGPEATIIKATQDYSAYASKQSDEMEHMVELYDFPASLETHDIISAFSLLNSDSMYVKWIDDTKALLILGSSSQAQKAIELNHPLIKVRPMSCASNLALDKAYQLDLKPAIKRPQTNLQTARRLITSHLGARSRVSKEQCAKEREDLRVAKELKKQAKQIEKDAWEGNF